ncbi:G-protein coupled receptor 183-like [Antedon mediterranea]|uniref:G-protein coupled receptor 183-like n=1 Tax=Antedon mediterranea TaxID=105859 RepID=UPI003AF9FE85
MRYVIGIVGVGANFLVAFVFLYNNLHKKSITHLLILHQSILDLFGCLFFPLFYNFPIYTDIRGSIICRCRTFFFYFLSASTQNLLILTIERYIAVVYPRKYFRKGQSLKKRRFLLSTPHVISVLSGIQLPIYADFVPEYPGSCDYFFPSEIIAKWSATIIFLTFWFIPVVVMSICYTRILYTLYERAKNTSLPSRSHASRKHKLKERRRDEVERNVINTLLMIYLAFLITLTPNIIYYIIYSFCNCLNLHSSLIHDITVILNAFNLVINPFIYAFKFRDFKQGVKVLLKHKSSSDDIIDMATINCSKASD